MPNFSTPDKILQTIRAGDDVATVQSDNRSKIQDAANCVPPLSKELAKKLGININVSWGGMMLAIAQARRQYLSALTSGQYFFRVKLPLAPAEHQSEWEQTITDNINRPLKESLQYFMLHVYRWTSVPMHGLGPMIWTRPDRWLPKYVAINDLRIPTDTLTDFSNLSWYAVRRSYTPGELLQEAFRPGKGNRWDKKAVYEILKSYKEINWTDPVNNYDYSTTVEKMHELWKQDGGWFSGDAMPSISLWHFYFEDNTDPDKDKRGWFMRIVPETPPTKGNKEPDKFLWTSDKPEAKSWQNLIHCQFGDLCNDAPFKVASVRSLGFALLEPTFYTNLTRCRMLQHIHDNFNIWLRTTDPIDKARAQVQEFGNLGMLRSGVTVVPQTERHQIDGDLVEMGMAQLKQLEQEASSSYTQSTDTGTQREQTAFETNVKVQQVNAMLSGLLLMAFKYEAGADREICRRFCMDTKKFSDPDPDIVKFQKRCSAAKIPKQWLDVDLWDVEPVTPLGMGNPTVAQASAKQLMELRPNYDPTAQQEILHEATLVITQDARKAARLAPLNKGRGVTDGARDAQSVFGTLMMGVPIPPREGLPVQDQVEAMLPLMAGKIVMMEKRNNMAEPDEAIGLQTVAQYIGQLIQRLAQNKDEKQHVKQYGDALGQLMNQVKGLAQRGEQAAQKQQANGEGGMDPTVLAKIQGMMMQHKAKAQATMAKSKLNAQQNAERFVREQRREDAKAVADIQRENLVHKAKVAGEVQRNRMKAFPEE